ncbi:MAG: hypothetical protein ABGX22_13470 [Pirellulaceae bacterium]|nr:hypothetical protein [Planctomycetaceae bacterium]
MSRKLSLSLLSMLMAIACLGSTGCVSVTSGPGFPLPIPISPYFQKQVEDRHWINEHYHDVPILDPLVPGGPTRAMDAPSDDEVMRALEIARPTQGGLALLHEVRRDNVRITKEKVADYIDPPRFIPLVGPAQLHHVHYKCTVYFEETTTVTWPVPHTLRNQEAVEVIYIDHNHFHRMGPPSSLPALPN